MIRLDIRARLYLIIGIFAVGLAITSATLVYQQTSSLKERRYEELKNLVQSVVSLIASQHAAVKAGQISEAEAKARALDLVSKLRYQGDNYFWINDSQPRVIMHPIRKDLDGKDVSGLKDPNGKALFVEFAAVAKTKGAGVVDYMWPKPGSEQPVEKSSYVALFEPWGWIVGTGVYNDDLVADRNRTIKTAAIACILVMLLISAISWLFIRVVTGGLASLKSAMLELANGNFNVVLPGLGRKDEIGDIAGAVETFKIKSAEKARLEADARTNLDRAAAAERDALTAKVMSDLDAAGGGIVQAAMTGDFSKRVPLDGKHGVIRNLAESLNTMCNNVGEVFNELEHTLRAMAQGDLTSRIDADYQGAFAALKDNANTMAARLSETVAEIRAAAQEVANASSEIATATTDLSKRTETQAACIEQTSASMEQISGTVKKNSESAQHASRLATDTHETASRSGDVVARAVEAMSRIEQSSRKISDIIGVIDEIARQTNLLALNAAVEAARAGDAGRGFAVVASEVRSLAQRSSQAAKDIKDLITKSGSQVHEGVELVNQAGQSLGEIVGSIKDVANIVTDIAKASTEQSDGIDQVNKALAQMDEVTQQNSALVEENAATSKTLERQAGAMSERVGTFKLDAAAHHDAPRRSSAATAPKPAMSAQPKPARSSRGPAGRTQSAAAVAMKHDDWKEF